MTLDSRLSTLDFFGASMHIVLLLIGFLAGCGDIAPNYVAKEDIDNAFGQRRLKTLCRALDMEDDATRQYGTERLRKIEGDEAFVKECVCTHIKIAKGPDTGKWDKAVGKGMKGEKRDELVQCFADAIREPGLPNRGEAIPQLAEMSAPAAKKALSDIAMAPGPAEGRVAAIRTLKGFSEFKPQLVKLMTDPEPAVRAAATAALSGYKEPEIVAAMVKAYSEDTEGSVRANALSSLKAAGVPEAEDMLCKAMLEDSSAEVRTNAILAFKGTKSDKAVGCLKKRAMTEETDAGVRTAMLTTLKSSPHKGSAEILCDAIPFWMKTYVKEEIPDKIPGTDIITAQNDRDFENSYACLQKANARAGGYSCYAKMYVAWWFEKVGGQAYIPKCPGYEDTTYSAQ